MIDNGEVQSLTTPYKSIVRTCSEEYCSKDTYLSKKAIQNKIWFIINGSAREFKTDSDSTESEHTIWFWYPDDVLYVTPGFFSQSPVQSSIQFLEDSHLLYISFEDYNYLKQNFAETEVITEKIRDYYETARHCYLLDRIRHNCEEKYQELFKSHPKLFNQAKLKDIASFLCVNPDTLSRFRKKKK